MSFTPAWWLPSPHLHTLWGRLARGATPPPSRTLRWETPDDDFVDIVRVDADSRSPRIVLLHGLEGSQRSHYARALMAEAHHRGWGADLLLFRSCGSDMNRERRFYHSGETTDLAFILGRIAEEFPAAPLALIGVSLGGNVLLKYLGERGADAPPAISAAAAISVPFDLSRGAHHLTNGFARVYEVAFLRSLRRKARVKLERFPGLLSSQRLEQARTLVDFDDAVTAPIHGFENAEDYYARSSSIRFLSGVRVPTLLLSARDDPFLPREVLAEVEVIARRNPALEMEFVEHGGHVGFVGGAVPWRATFYAQRRVMDFLAMRFPRS